MEQASLLIGIEYGSMDHGRAGIDAKRRQMAQALDNAVCFYESPVFPLTHCTLYAIGNIRIKPKKGSC